MPINPASGPSLAGPALARGNTMSRTALRLPKHRDAWTFCVSPTKLQCIDGEILPELSKAWHTPGMNGNGAGRGQGQGFVSNLMGEGFVPVPHDIDCEAFGESRAGAPLSAYLDRHQGVSRGRSVVYHSDAWERPYQLGNATDWKRDHEGWKAFLRKCLAIVSPDGLVDLQVRIAVDPLVRRIRAAQDRDDARGRRMLVKMFSNLPAEHCPDDLLAAREAVMPKTKTQRKSAR
jgi:hypothetical protein